jgi:hypothetical protein
MKTLIAIPTYWSTENYGLQGQKIPVYDHTTPINTHGTFTKTLESLKNLKDTDFEVVIIASAVSVRAEKAMIEKLKIELSQFARKNRIKIYLLSPIELEKIRKVIQKEYDNKYDVFLDIKGYSRVRNLSLMAALILNADILISIDDDDCITDTHFLSKAREFIGTDFNGKTVDGIAGYYVYENNRIHIIYDKSRWRSVWNQASLLNKAFDMFINRGPRLKEAHLMLGGCSVLHKNLFSKVPYDNRIPRGEDMDYITNAKMFGFTIFFDRKLFIKHEPSPVRYPLWKTHRTDINRFIFQREKHRKQRAQKNIHKVTMKELTPYTSAFIGKGLDRKIEKSCTIMAEQYQQVGDTFSAARCLESASLGKTENLPKYNVFIHYLLLQSKWVSFSKVFEKKEIKSALKKCLLVFN